MRLEGQAKGGYYPTDIRMSAALGRVVMLDRYASIEKITVLDPCCGEGTAVRVFAEEVKKNSDVAVKVYGIELNKERAEKARSVLDKVLNDDTFNVIIQPTGTFSVIFLNPPYDIARKGERMELKFLRRARVWLAEYGVLFFIVPYTILSRKDISSYLAKYFWIKGIYQFTDTNEAGLYRQVVVVLEKRKRPLYYENNIEESRQALRDVQQVTTISLSEPILYLEAEGQEPEIFTSGRISPEEMVAWAEEKSPLIRKIKASIFKKDDMDAPLMTLRKGHLMQLLVSGGLNGRIQSKDGSEILLKGTMIKDKRTLVATDKKEVRKDIFKIHLTYMDSAGEVKEVEF